MCVCVCVCVARAGTALDEGEVPGRSRAESSHATPRDSILAVFEVTGNYARKHLYAGGGGGEVSQLFQSDSPIHITTA